MEKKLRFTRHAKRRKRLYKIELNDVLSAIEAPDRRYEESGYGIVEKSFSGKYKGMPLKVVFVHEKDAVEIVSCYPLKRRHGRKP